MSKNQKPRRNKAFTIFTTICVLLVLGSGAFVAGLWMGFFESDEPVPPAGDTLSTQGGSVVTKAPTETATVPTEPTQPQPEKVVATATISTTGDVLMHMPVVNSCQEADGTYNFDEIFQYLKAYSEAADYAVANLETTLAGTDNGYKYSGYPMFNCPDEIVDGVQNAGFDMLLTANNHCYDTRTVGLTRTLEVVADKGLDTLGTYASADDAKYLIKEINGIKIGMICYTYETEDDYANIPSINGILMKKADVGMINTFSYNHLDDFYQEVTAILEAMEAEGAEATMMFIHWGNEYQLKQNSLQTKTAQGLCDLGIDVIVGGHPHVVQPIDLLTSTTDPEHKTVCLYSLGNAVSNQRLGNISYVSTAHTEDGMLFSVTFAKYSDGTVVLESTDILPCWVNMTTAGNRSYYILPLDDETTDRWQDLYDLTNAAYNSAVNSYERTMDIVGEGLEKCQTYLADAKALREWEYLAAVNPEAAGERPTMETEPTEAE